MCESADATIFRGVVWKDGLVFNSIPQAGFVISYGILPALWHIYLKRNATTKILME